MITNAVASVLAHTSNTGRYVGEGHALMEIARAGLLHDHGAQDLAGGAHYLTITGKGREALQEWRSAQPKPPRAKRRSPAFDSWYSYCDVCQRIPFGEFLKTVWPNRREWAR